MAMTAPRAITPRRVKDHHVLEAVPFEVHDSAVSSMERGMRSHSESIRNFKNADMVCRLSVEMPADYAQTALIRDTLFVMHLCCHDTSGDRLVIRATQLYRAMT